MYDIASARVAFEFLHSEMPLESFAAKYSQGLSGTYADVPDESLLGAAQGMLEFLAEIEAGENAAVLLSHFTYHRLYFAGVAMPRKMKPMFGSIEDAAKQKEYSEELAKKAFRAYVFRLRSNPEDAAPSNWSSRMMSIRGHSVILFASRCRFRRPQATARQVTLSAVHCFPAIHHHCQ